MAKITFGPTVSAARGKVGDTVFTRARGGNVARALSLAAAGVGPHNLLSTTHPDTTPATPPARGSLITGQEVPTAWKELALGANGKVLTSDATDTLWADPASLALGDPVTVPHGGTGVLAPFTPPAGCTLWLKADAITGLNDGNPVATWLDSSGADRHATQATEAKRPHYKTNIVGALPVVRFEQDNNEFLVGPSGTSQTVFVVTKISSGGDYNQIWTSPPSSTCIRWKSSTTYAGTAPYNDSDWSWENTTKFFVNGVNTETYPDAFHLVSSEKLAPVTNTFQVGGAYLDTRTWDGDIAELLVFSGTLSPADRQEIEGYLAWKWGFQASLPDGHPYKSAPPASYTTKLPVTSGGTGVQTCATGQILIASGADVAEFTTPDGARVYNSAAETITTNTLTALTFNSERYDNGGLHSTTSNTDRLTALKAGKYSITAHVVWTGPATPTGFRLVSIRLNGTTFIALEQLPAITDAFVGTCQSIATIYHLTAESYVQLVVSHSQGANLTVMNIAAHSPEFAMQWLGP